VIGPDEVLDWNHPVGIALDVAARTVDEGRLFSSCGAVLRDGWGLVAEVDGCSLLPESGLIKLGGDGRMARLSPWVPPAVDWSSVRAAVDRSARFRLVLQTPAIFEAGWRPGILRQEDGALVLDRGRLRARLVGAAVGAPELAGGWDLVRRGPKPFRLMAPAGSVYWFEVVSGRAGDAWDDLHGTSISDERTNEGYGLIHVGGWAHV
jgi:CRISPR-associated protein Cmr3